MALAGTLSDFSLADIFQLISLQKKTGYLTLRSEVDVVTVTFFEGTVVGAESLNKRIEDRLGHVLVKTNRISKEELAKALDIQRQTLQRLGYILISENFVDSETLRSALTTQMQQTIFRLFRWRDGEYNFEPKDTVEYDRENVTPMAAESILMEGIRMLDEWPLIEKKIPNFDLVFEQIPLPVPPILETRAEAPPMEDIFGGAFGDDKAKPKEAPVEEDALDGAVTLSQEEMAVYQLVNGFFSVQEIVDRSTLNEFEACKALFELLNRQLIREVLPEEDLEAEEKKRPLIPPALLEQFLTPLFWGWIGISIILLPFHPLDHMPWTMSSLKHDRMILKTQQKLNTISGAIRLYEMRTSRPPASLQVLVKEEYLPLHYLSDSFEQPFFYQVGEDGYTLASRGSRGRFPADLSISAVNQATPSE